uniref:WAS/WASL-interacting protein family member 2-like n=1 Tax=Knipowitschia caucasica TaxID=637954 RepID=A0AAV2KP22_KNICA
MEQTPNVCTAVYALRCVSGAMPHPPSPPGGPPPPPTHTQSPPSPSEPGALFSEICRGSDLKRGSPQLSHAPSDKSKVCGDTAASNGSGATSPSDPAAPMGGASKLRASADGSSRRSPRAAAPRPPGHRHDIGGPSPTPPPQCRRGNAPSPPVSAPRPPTSGGNPTLCSLAPPPPHHHGNGDGPDPPQRNNSLNKRPAPTCPAPTRGPAPPPPSPAHLSARLHPPNKDPPPRATAPPTPVMSSPRPGCREAPPPPPGSPAPSDPSPRGKPPLPPIAQTDCNGSPRRPMDDFESKYSFHPLDDFPPPEEYRHFTKIYPSKADQVMRGAPPLPPVASAKLWSCGLRTQPLTRDLIQDLTRNLAHKPTRPRT